MATAAADARSAPRWPFTAAIFAGSFLLFLVQPLLARMALPTLGGAPAVWNSAMLVYQALLLAGYAYAHWLGRLAPRLQVAVHLGLLLLAALTLPLALAERSPPTGADPVLWVPWLLLLSVGPLFFAISAQSPLLQRWFGLASGADPYPLFVASNLGSFAGLLAYPLLLEPLTGVAAQSTLWLVGYGVMLLLLALAALPLFRKRTAGPRVAEAGQRVPFSRLARWALIASVPSGLMLSTTLHLTTDVAPMPLLWVIPLGLYLLSFSIAFAERRGPARWAAAGAPFALVLAAGTLFIAGTQMMPLVALAALLAMVLGAVALHARLFDERPQAAQLTLFYLALSVGGMLGGIFCALVAPLLFDWTYEHPLLLLAAAWLVGDRQPIAAIRETVAGPAAARALAVGALILAGATLLFWWRGEREPLVMVSALAAGLASFSLGRRALFTAAIALTLLAGGGLQRLAESAVPGKLTRSYFGTYRIMDQAGTRMLIHGTTTHGVQLLGPPERRRTPTSYYWRGSGVGRVMEALPTLVGTGARVGLVGLGTGTLSCYARPDQRWTVFEIDPAMVEIARSRFSFLADCKPDARIVVGDARLRLAGEPPASFDVLVVDAFSSDAIPMHLLTREAFAVYARALRPGGLLMVHISNRHLELRPVVRTGGEYVGMRGLLGSSGSDPLSRGYDSSWTALTSDPALLERVAKTEDGLWVPLPFGRRVHWSDDRASILPIVQRPW
ncbi:fused MFS/spermidine synthase [Sphingomonas swuensis]|uniref:Fused MFS/spermidine synthase n=1 Tax=Sphingomonas swuensis TaxID=977800 RepID=A0ABP7SNF0_9SPHN